MSDPLFASDRLELCGGGVDLVSGELSGGLQGRLTERERALLAYLAARPGRVVPRSELAVEVFGYRPHVRTRVVDKAMCTLRRKVERDRSSPEHLLSRHGTGYLFVPLTRPVTSTEMPLSTVPSPLDGFVGRVAELEQLEGDVAANRLVTVVGPGGVGKTRLVLQLIEARAASWPGGAVFCDLGDARSGDGITYALTRAVGGASEDPRDVLARGVASRGRCLVVLDNVEQIASELVPTIARGLAATEHAHVVLTSRERLGMAGERVFELAPMSDDDARALYLARAEASRPRLSLSEADRDALPEVLRLLDGLPLAIELAAARAELLMPSELLPRLAERFRVLSRRRGPVDRHLSLLATLDWSWDLLTAEEQAAAAALSVFEGGFTLDAAEAVLDTAEATELLQSLLDQSWLRRVDDHRFGFLISTHAYLADKLVDAGSVQRRHGAYFASGDPEAEADPRELDNLLVACRRATAQGWVDIAASTLLASWSVFRRHGPHAAWIELAREVLDCGVPSTLEAWICLRAARFARWLGRVDEGLGFARRGLQAARRAPTDPSVEARLELLIVVLYVAAERVDEARAVLKNLVVAHRTTDDTRILNPLASALLQTGELGEATTLFERARALERASGDTHGESLVLIELALCYGRAGRLHDAVAANHRALAMFRESGHRIQQATTLGLLADAQIELGAFAEARDHAEQAMELLAEAGRPESRSLARIVLGNARFELGDVDGARAELAAAMDQARASGDLVAQSYVLTVRGDLACHEGDPDAARSSFLRALELARRTIDRRLQGRLLKDLGRVEILDGNSAAAEEWLVRGLACLGDDGDVGLVAEVHAWLAIARWTQGRLGEAREALERAEAAGPLPHIGTQRAIARARDVLDRPLTVAAGGHSSV